MTPVTTVSDTVVTLALLAAVTTVSDTVVTDGGLSLVDRFVGESLAAAGIEPAPEADPRTLLRRVTFDLTGLPPTVEEMDAFLADREPLAYERAVERLLASPAYGERQGRRFLDLARYADTAGDSSDYPVADAWRYRDWVIGAFDRDMPYDEFVRLQIAGDLLRASEPEERRVEGIVATGFIALSRRFGVGVLSDRHLIVDDTIDTVSRAILGETIACARCHDHKSAPYTQRDYAALYGIFDGTRYPFPGAEERHHPENLVPLAPKDAVAAAEKAHAEKMAGLALARDAAAKAKAALDADAAVAAKGLALAFPGGPVAFDVVLPAEAIYAIDAGFDSGEVTLAIDGEALPAIRAPGAAFVPLWRRAGTRRLAAGRHTVGVAATTRVSHVRFAAVAPAPGEIAAAAATLAAADAAEKAGAKDAPKFDTAYAVAEGTPHDEPVHERGNPWQKKGPPVPRGFPASIAVANPPAIGPGESGRRELADWLARPDHPLTARTFVDRVWGWRFGRALSETHPELLAALARFFVHDAGWSVKALHRAIVTSRAYRSAAAAPPNADPENALLSRFPRRRLEAEEIRDTVLFVSGALDPARGGPHPFPPVERWHWSQHDPFRATYASRKRSVYLMTPRIQRHPYLGLFDGADANACTDSRGETTVPAQALFFLNGDLVQDASRAFADRLLSAADDDRARAALAHRIAFAREAGEEEIAEAAAFLAEYRAALESEHYPGVERAAWAGYCRTLLMSNELITID